MFQGKSQAFEAIVREEAADPVHCLERTTAWFAELLFEDAIFTKLFVRELLEGDSNRLEFLTKNVFQGPFSALVAMALAFVKLKDWHLRQRPDLKLKALTGRATKYLSQIKEAMTSPSIRSRVTGAPATAGRAASAMSASLMRATNTSSVATMLQNSFNPSAVPETTASMR